MSLDVYFEYPACEHCGSPGGTVCQFNYTYNCIEMWHLAGWDDRASEDKPAGEMTAMLKTAIQTLEREKERFDAMNPSNGWGFRSGLVRNFLGPMYAASLKYPRAIATMWR